MSATPPLAAGAAAEQAPAWAAALGRVPSGLFILTAAHQGQTTGMLASWVQQASFDPPSISVALAHKRYLADWLSAGCAIAVHILAPEDKALLKHFGRGFEPGQEAFAGLEVTRDEAGVPILAAAPAYLSAVTTGRVEVGDHAIFVARIRGGELRRPFEPSIHLRRSGLGY